MGARGIVWGINPEGVNGPRGRPPPGQRAVQRRFETLDTSEQYVGAEGWREVRLDGARVTRVADARWRGAAPMPHDAGGHPGSAGIAGNHTPRACCLTAWQRDCRDPQRARGSRCRSRAGAQFAPPGVLGASRLDLVIGLLPLRLSGCRAKITACRQHLDRDAVRCRCARCESTPFRRHLVGPPHGQEYTLTSCAVFGTTSLAPNDTPSNGRFALPRLCAVSKASSGGGP